MEQCINGGKTMPDSKLVKKHFVLKTIAPRPTFQQDMTEEERNIMLQHFAYWTDFADKGIILVFGPVFDPKGGYGLGIAEVENEEQVIELLANDPAVTSGLLKAEYHPMRANFPKNR
jgi:uncharacterized protein